MLQSQKNKDTLSILSRMRKQGAPGAPASDDMSGVTPQMSTQADNSDELSPESPPEPGQEPENPPAEIPEQPGPPAPEEMEPNAPMGQNMTTEKKRKLQRRRV